ncbi:MAG: CsbD family protein [Anaerolineae bacterium]
MAYGDILKGKWKQLRGEVQQQWGKLTDDELDRVEGHREELVGLLQERYGYAKQEAEDQLDKFLDDIEQSV